MPLIHMMTLFIPMMTLLVQEKRMLDDLYAAEGCSVDEYAAALEKVRLPLRTALIP